MPIGRRSRPRWARRRSSPARSRKPRGGSPPALGVGRPTAVSYSNLGAALLMVDGPRASMECGREGLAFAEARGLREMASFLRNGILTTLVCSGAWDDALRLGAQVAQEARDA